MRPVQIRMAGFGSYADETIISFDGIDSDLFLVTGDTGAGKTTIFDAITFALYGETSGQGKERDATELCSQYAEAKESYVELTFTEGSGDAQKTYRVRRCPARWRPITRGANKGQLKRDDSTVELYDPDGARSTSKSEVEARLHDIIGLTKMQFAQVGMLAQGEFMSFLGASSSEKRPILRKLFGTELFEQIQRSVKEKAGSRQMQVQAAWNQICALTAQIRVPDGFPQAQELGELVRRVTSAAEPDVAAAEEVVSLLADLHVYQSRAVSQAAEFQAQQTAAYDRAAAALKEAEVLAGFFQEAEQAARKLEELRSRQEEMIGKQTLLNNLRKAAAIQRTFSLLESSRLTLRQKSRDLETQQTKLPQLETRLKLDEQTAVTARTRAEQMHLAYGRKKQAVESALQVFEKISSIQKEIGSLTQAEKKALTESIEMEQKAQALRQSVDNIRLELDGLRDVPLEEDRCRQGSATVREAFASYNARQQRKKDSAHKLKVYENAVRRYEDAKTALDAAQKAYYDNQAGLLARTLEPGQPCPVCGALEHPHPAAAVAGQAPSKQVLDREQKKLDKLMAEWHEASVASSEAQAQAENAEKTFSEAMAKIQVLAQTFGIHLAGRAHQRLSEVETAFANLGTQIKEKMKRRAELERMLQKQTADLPAVLEKAQQAASSRLEAEQKRAADEARLAELKQQVSYVSVDEANRELEEAASQLQQADDAQKKADQAVSRIQQAVSAARARIDQLQAEIPGLEAAAAGNQKLYEAEMLQQKLGEPSWQSFADPELQARTDALDREVQDFSKDLHAGQKLSEQAQSRIQGREMPDLEADRKRADQLRQERDRAIEAAKALEAAEKADGWLAAQLSSSLETHREQAAEYGRLHYLSKRLSGSLSEARIDLETFVLRYYLQDILEAANRRFRDMTAGEYELRLLDYEKGEKGKNGGLDLTVYSRITNATRNIDTLSGGESFMAALSLSLGMADIIEQYSSAVQLDVMFIDEGFGSLDDNARREAVKILQRMTDGSKIVGIISHVTELKNEIDRQLLVTKDSRGSHARWAPI